MPGIHGGSNLDDDYAPHLSKKTPILDGLLKKPAPKTASFTFICENEAFKDEGFAHTITPNQYARIRAILAEDGAPKIILPGQGN